MARSIWLNGDLRRLLWLAANRRQAAEVDNRLQELSTQVERLRLTLDHIASTSESTARELEFAGADTHARLLYAVAATARQALGHTEESS